MMLKFFKYIMPVLCVFALLIWLSGDNSLYENFTINLLNNLSIMDVKNPATEFAEILESFEKISNSFYEMSHPDDIWQFFTSYFNYMANMMSISFILVKCIVLVLYDLVYNLIQFVKLIIDTTGVGTMG